MTAKRLKIAVLMGGIGRERDVSIQSGACAIEALVQAGFHVMGWDIGPDRMEILEDQSINVFFLALHGAFGEDGQLQEILEQKGLTYTGSGPEACRLSFDKMATKQRLAEAGMDAPQSLEFTADVDPRQLDRALKTWGPRVVVKPIRQGSSVGVHILDRPDQVGLTCQKVLAEFGDCMVEQFIPGREITVGVLLGRALPVIEIRPVQGFYDYHAKYIDDQTQYLFGTRSASLEQSVQSKALACFEALGLRHFGRIDFILHEDRTPYALEANAIPGLTRHSLLPKAAAQVGVPMDELCSQVVMAAYQDRA
jgi:D-alanine-D-alanine ligase